MIIKKIAAVSLALVLSLGMIGTASVYAQAPTFPICDPSYVGDVCIPPKPPDLDCVEISERNIEVAVGGNDPHDLDRDSDGIGCEAPVTSIGGGPIQTEPTPEATPEPTPEVPPVIPAENETQTPEPTPEATPEPEVPQEIPIEVNETIPIPVPPNMTTGNETEPVPLPINETQTPTGENETIEIPELPVEPEQPPTGEQGNQTEQLPEEIPAANGTDTVPIEIPINSSTGNETIPVPPIEVTPPTENATTTGPGGINTTEPGVTPTEPPVFGNSTEAFDNVVNASAILEERLQDTGDDANETQRADLRAAIGESLGAMGETKDLIINATNDQLFDIQNIANTLSEAIDVVTDEGE